MSLNGEGRGSGWEEEGRRHRLHWVDKRAGDSEEGGRGEDQERPRRVHEMSRSTFGIPSQIPITSSPFLSLLPPPIIIIILSSNPSYPVIFRKEREGEGVSEEEGS